MPSQGPNSQSLRFLATASLSFFLLFGSSGALKAFPDFRTIDGAGNNVANPDWGSADIQLRRQAPEGYGDGIETLAGALRPGPREISNAVCAQIFSIPNGVGASDFVWQWGQFIDHDMDLTETTLDAADITTPVNDPFFLGSTISFTRSVFDPATSVPGVPRQQLNSITAFLDGSNVYGSDMVRHDFLRDANDPALLMRSPGNLLPFNTGGFPNAAPPGSLPEDFFLAGDVRANEQVGLTALHTLFMREHNKVAKRLRQLHPAFSDERVFQFARMLVGAEIQAITYNEFIPVLLGPGALDPYAGYDSLVDPSIQNAFSTACYRLGHSMLSTTLLRLDRTGQEIPEGNLSLSDAFFDPSRIIDEGGIGPILMGLATQVQQQVDTQVVPDVRNFLFGPPGSGGFDLASLNIQRGRDHGLGDYNTIRTSYGLAPVTAFSEITSSIELQGLLQQLYGTVNDIDAWIGGLAEDHVPGALVGELIFTVLKDQFERLRDGDRFFYLNALPASGIATIEAQPLSRIIRRNSEIRSGEIQTNVFLAQ